MCDSSNYKEFGSVYGVPSFVVFLIRPRQCGAWVVRLGLSKQRFIMGRASGGALNSTWKSSYDISPSIININKWIILTVVWASNMLSSQFLRHSCLSDILVHLSISITKAPSMARSKWISCVSSGKLHFAEEGLWPQGCRIPWAEDRECSPFLQGERSFSKSLLCSWSLGLWSASYRELCFCLNKEHDFHRCRALLLASLVVFCGIFLYYDIL